MKKAVLVRVSLVTRVVVDETASEMDILELAVPRLCENLMSSPYENMDEIVVDTECPYKPELDNEEGFRVGDDVIAPEPTGSDMWNFGDWVGSIESIKEDTDGKVFADVRDGDGDIFCINLERLKLAED